MFALIMSAIEKGPGHDRHEIVPRLRGVSHAVAFWLALLAAGFLLLRAGDGAARAAAAIYGLGLCALFGVSASYHRWRWDPRWRPLLRRLDHSTIFVFIAASYTPIALLVLGEPLRTVVLLVVWAGAAAGVIFSVAWIGAPRWLAAGTYLSLGWVSVVTLPELLDRLGTAPLLLIGAGGGLYTVGAVVYGLKRPDPWPRVFGFHEVFHACVVVAAAAHYAAIAGWVVT